MDQISPELYSVLQCLSLNGHLIFSLMDDVTTFSGLHLITGKTKQEGMVRDTADICVCLLSHNPAGLERVLNLGRASCTCSRFGVGLTGPQRVLSLVYSQGF